MTYRIVFTMDVEVTDPTALSAANLPLNATDDGYDTSRGDAVYPELSSSANLALVTGLHERLQAAGIQIKHGQTEVFDKSAETETP